MQKNKKNSSSGSVSNESKNWRKKKNDEKKPAKNFLPRLKIGAVNVKVPIKKKEESDSEKGIATELGMKAVNFIFYSFSFYKS